MRGLAWWYWLATAAPLAADLLLGWGEGRTLAAAACLGQAAHFALARGGTSFPIQVRLAWLVLLLLAGWWPAPTLAWALLLDTLALLTVDRSLLARALSLLHRPGPLTRLRVAQVLLAPPLPGSELQGLSGPGAPGLGPAPVPFAALRGAS